MRDLTSLQRCSRCIILLAQPTGLGGDKTVHTFPKVNVIARLEFDFDYFEAAFQHFSHYTI